MRKTLFILIILFAIGWQQSKAYNNYIEAYSYNSTEMRSTGSINVPSVKFYLKAEYQSFYNNGTVVLSARARIDIAIYNPITYKSYNIYWDINSLSSKSTKSFSGTYNCYNGDYIYWIRVFAVGQQYVSQNSHGGISAIAPGQAIAYY